MKKYVKLRSAARRIHDRRRRSVSVLEYKSKQITYICLRTISFNLYSSILINGAAGMDEAKAPITGDLAGIPGGIGVGIVVIVLGRTIECPGGLIKPSGITPTPTVDNIGDGNEATEPEREPSTDAWDTIAAFVAGVKLLGGGGPGIINGGLKISFINDSHNLLYFNPELPKHKCHATL